MNKVIRILVLAAVAVAIFSLSAGNVAASSAPYLQINNGDKVSVSRGENVRVVIQLGSQSGLKNVGVLCLTTANQITGGVKFNGFKSGTISPDGLRISYPTAFDYLKNPPVAGDFLSAIPGQNYNVGFTIKAQSNSTLLCALVDGPKLVNTLNSLGLNILTVPAGAFTPALIDQLIQAKVILAADALTVEVR
jgi:hypothetical protein